MNHIIMPTVPLILVPPTGRSKLPLVEIDRVKVQTKGSSIALPEAERATADCTYGSFGPGLLEFTAWELCHAAKKTELTRTFSAERANELGLLFAHEHHERFKWDNINLRCVDGSGMWLEDFSAIALAGRIGEALAYLTMTKMWGYIYWDKIASVWLRAARNASFTHDDMVKVAKFTGNVDGQSAKPQPDFVFEKSDMTVALMEAKGSFVTPGNKRIDAKRALSHGLDQLANWAPLIAPSPAKSIVIGSFLREAGDSCSDPSLIMHVDPPAEGNPDIKPVEFPPDEIRRGNFGAWLIGMGFRNSGLALVDRREIDIGEVELPIVNFKGVDFALSVQGWRVDRHQPAYFPLPIELFLVLLRDQLDFLKHFGITGVYALGLEVSTLRAVCDALKDPSSNSMMDLPTIDFDRQRKLQDMDGFYGSVFPDGSLMGIVSSNHFESIKTQTFEL